MKKYKCHKEVQAFKIVEIFDDVTAFTMFSEADSPTTVSVSLEYMEKHNPQVGGYYVRYADGYESYSPAKAFEEGYKLIN